jgi:hypothetical protein
MKNQIESPECFRSIQEHECYAAVVALWKKAKTASLMRHASLKQGRRKAAMQFGFLKARCIQRAQELAPDLIRQSIDKHYIHDMPSFHFHGHGRLHLPSWLIAPTTPSTTN